MTIQYGKKINNSDNNINNNDELFEYWFIRMAGSTDEADFALSIRDKPYDDYECDDDSVCVNCSYCDDDMSFVTTCENRNAFCFNLFNFIFY